MLFKIICDDKVYEVRTKHPVNLAGFYAESRHDSEVYFFYNARCLSEMNHGNIPLRDIILPISRTTIQKVN